MPGAILNCREVVATLDDYLEAGMNGSRWDAVAVHLSGCEKCSAYLRSYIETVGAAKNAFTMELEERLPEEVVKTILRVRKGR